MRSVSHSAGVEVHSVVDPRVGIVHALHEVAVRPGSPRFFHYTAQLCNLRACGWQGNLGSMDGTAAQRECARSAAVLEALRCYAAAFFAPEELELFTYRDAPHRATAPAAFPLFSDQQYAQPEFAFERFTDATPIRWMAATSLNSGDTWYVPAAAVLLPYAVTGDGGEAAIQPSSPIGLACATARHDAIAAGICDVVKSDRLALCWHGRLSLPQIRVETLSDRNYDLVERFETIGHLTAFDVTLDAGPPVILLCLRCSTEDAPAMVFGAGCDPHPERAFRLAVEDLALALRYCQDLATARPRGAEALPVGSRLDHLAFWSRADSTPLAQFLFASTERLEFDELTDRADASREPQHDRLLRSLRDAGLDPLIVDLTTSDLRALGLSVIRAVIPGLQPLFVGADTQALGGSRLASMSSKRSIREAATSGAPAAILPHPFLVRGRES